MLTVALVLADSAVVTLALPDILYTTPDARANVQLVTRDATALEDSVVSTALSSTPTRSRNGASRTA